MSLTGPSFFCIFEKSGINEAISQLRGSTPAIISAHLPGLHMWASAGLGPNSSSPKQWKLENSIKIYNSVSARLPLTKSKKEKTIESTAMLKRACQCTDGLSATQKWQRGSRDFQHLSGVEPMSPSFLRPTLTTRP